MFFHVHIESVLLLPFVICRHNDVDSDVHLINPPTRNGWLWPISSSPSFLKAYLAHCIRPAEVFCFYSTTKRNDRAVKKAKRPKQK
ncbi:hypothetical protein Plhal304r1_c089g0170981 [Plasmopara halstedii]